MHKLVVIQQFPQPVKKKAQNNCVYVRCVVTGISSMLPVGPTDLHENDMLPIQHRERKTSNSSYMNPKQKALFFFQKIAHLPQNFSPLWKTKWRLHRISFCSVSMNVTYPLPSQPNLSATSRVSSPCKIDFISSDMVSGNSTSYNQHTKQ